MMAISTEMNVTKADEFEFTLYSKETGECIGIFTHWVHYQSGDPSTHIAQLNRRDTTFLINRLLDIRLLVFDERTRKIGNLLLVWTGDLIQHFRRTSIRSELIAEHLFVSEWEKMQMRWLVDYDFLVRHIGKDYPVLVTNMN
jgi:hypothetical protein